MMHRRKLGIQKRQDHEHQGSLSRDQPFWAPYLLIMIIGIAFGLRVWGIDYGLPYEITYHQITFEEAKEVHRAFKLGAGEYHWTFGKGGLYYLLFFEYAIFYVVLWGLGWVNNAHEFALYALRDRTIFFLAGRLTVAVMGTLTCLAIYSISRRVYDWRVGLGAALIGATAYFHTLFSAVINVDIGMTLALWASILAYLKYEETQQLRWLTGAGALGAIAIAFKLPGTIILPLLLLAIGTCREKWQNPRQMCKEAGIVVVTLLVILTVVAPEWTLSVGTIHENFSRLLGSANPMPGEDSFQATIDSITIESQTGKNYFERLFSQYNVILTLSALLGAGLGLWRRHRWDMIWTVFIVAFLTIMSLADRDQPERYLMPIMPALWLLSSRLITAWSQRHWGLAVVGFVCVIALPLTALVRHDYEKTKPDTRVLAKQWIEANIPSGAKILMDGMRYRFIQSPPLHPDAATITRQVTAASEEGSRLSRGVSQRALSLYTKAMQQVKGPTYELHSTEWGLKVQDVDGYIQACFDYIITSSYVTARYNHEINRQRFPMSAQFYEQLQHDPRLRSIYTVAPVPWKQSGPKITVYELAPPCEASQSSQ